MHRVRLLGGPSQLEFTRDERGLTVTLPGERPTGAVRVYVLAIDGRALVD